jgi:trans-aconitate methyltransferase
MAYLGTSLSPDNYYQHCGDVYYNPHSDLIKYFIESQYSKLDQSSRILDLGCGDGLATKILLKLGISNIIGIDKSQVMVNRYEKETGCKALNIDFWDELPQASSIVATHSLHLCPPSRIFSTYWKFKEIGIKTALITSPLPKMINKFINFPGLKSEHYQVCGAFKGGKTIDCYFIKIE